MDSYSALKSSIARWIGRSDLTGDVDDAIDLAEARFNRELKHRKMIDIADLTPTDGVVTLPADYLDYLQVTEKATRRRDLSYMSIRERDQLYDTAQAGLSDRFTIINGSLYTYPKAQNNIELIYRAKIPALSDVNTTNWILADAPDLYLRACQLELLSLINEHNTPRYRTLSMLVSGYIDQLNEQSQLSEFSGASIRPDMITP